MDERPGRGTRWLSIRIVVVPALIVALVASMGGSSLAAERRTRTAARTYLVPRASAQVQGGLVLTDTRGCAGSARLGCVRFATRPRDSHVRVTVRDASNTGPVFAVMAQDLDGDGVFAFGEPRIAFCGVSKRMEIPEPGTDLDVFVYEARDAGVTFGGYFFPPVAIPYVLRCRDGGIATAGTVKATFYR